jgi:hypothetical protein
MERIAMNQEERDWLDWLKRAKDGTVTQRLAAEKMGIRDRWVRALLAKMEMKGDAPYRNILPSPLRADQFQPFQLGAVGGSLRQIILRLLHEPAFGATAKNLGQPDGQPRHAPE